MTCHPENAAVVPKLTIRPQNHANISTQLCKHTVFTPFNMSILFSKPEHSTFNQRKEILIFGPPCTHTRSLYVVVTGPV